MATWWLAWAQLPVVVMGDGHLAFPNADTHVSFQLFVVNLLLDIIYILQHLTFYSLAVCFCFQNGAHPGGATRIAEMLNCSIQSKQFRPLNSSQWRMENIVP